MLKDHGNGTVDVQYSLLGGQLGSEERKSKKEVMSLKRYHELDGVWLKVEKIKGKVKSEREKERKSQCRW